MALSINHMIPNRALDHMAPNAPPVPESDESPVASSVTDVPSPVPSDSEFHAYVMARHVWFHSVGAGGSAYAKPVVLDSFAKVLGSEDEATYREIFDLIGTKKFTEALALKTKIQDKVLMGHVDAAFLLSDTAPVSYAQLADWLKNYNDLPEARDVYAKAQKLGKSGALTRPAAVSRLGGNSERAEGSGALEWNAKSLSAGIPDKLHGTFLKLVAKNKGDDAVAWIAAETKSGRLSDAAATSAHLTLAENLMWHGDFAKAWALVKGRDLSRLTNADYAHWISGLVAWSQNEFQTAYTHFSQLAVQADLPAPNRAAAAFWASRAATTCKLSAESKKMRLLAANYPRSFYGILALTGNESAAPDYNWTTPAFTAQQAGQIKQLAAGKRALALLQIHEVLLAQTELGNMPGKDSIRTGLLALATRYTMPSLALQTSSGSGDQPRRDAALYPLMPWQPDGGYASDPALVLAVAKNESRFDHEARSPAGAMGVMQVMPQTAEIMQRGASRRLYDPGFNVTLGDRYLDRLTRTDGVKDNLLLIIGSYNWGPDNLVRYYNARHLSDPLLFLEAMPVKETRDYIQNVMSTYWVYRARFNKPLTAMVELAVGRWPRYKADTGLRLTEK